MRKALLSLALLVVPAFVTLTAYADTADFYKGKTMQMVIGTSPGGDYDTPFMMVTNIIKPDGKPLGSFGDGEMWFHHDTSYYPEPNRATLLYSMKLPTWGGNTCFSNMYQAYENIPRKLRDRL